MGKITEIPTIFIQARDVLERLNEANYEAYFVGGSVRDLLMKKEINDVDIATSALPLEVKALFKSTVDIGIEHGTVLVLTKNGKYEVTTFRTESEYEDYRRPDKVEFVRSLTEDLKRRDFKMNAIAMDKDGEIIDLFDGVADINNHRICAVGNPNERFNEDALRMMRGIRFASQLDFEIEEHTYQAIRDNHNLLQHISIERIYQEWLKLIQGKNPQKGIALLLDSGCYQACPLFADYLAEMQIFGQKIMQATPTEKSSWLLLTYLCQLDVKEAKKWLKRWKCSNDVINTVVTCLPYFKLRMQRNLNKYELYLLGEEQCKLVEEVYSYFAADASVDTIQDEYQNLKIKSIQDVNVDGKELLTNLNAKPGPWLGQFFKTAQEEIVLDNWPNEKEFLLKQARKCFEKVQK